MISYAFLLNTSIVNLVFIVALMYCLLTEPDQCSTELPDYPSMVACGLILAFIGIGINGVSYAIEP